MQTFTHESRISKSGRTQRNWLSMSSNVFVSNVVAWIGTGRSNVARASEAYFSQLPALPSCQVCASEEV